MASNVVTRKEGYNDTANRISLLRKRKAYQRYVYNFIDTVTRVAFRHHGQDKLKIPMYEDGKNYTGDDRCVIWLKK